MHFSPEGNIKFGQIEHSWKGEKCIYCGASKQIYDREDNLETHAYGFIHPTGRKVISEMKFDVIIGNPPYHLDDGGYGASATPIYHKFVQQAIKLNPRYLTMIIPSRWFAGGRTGDLSDFRKQMLNDKRLRVLNDFVRAQNLFPSVEIKGGVNYFLWERDNPGLCKVVSHHSDGTSSEASRKLLEPRLDTFIRTNEAIPIFNKVRTKNEKTFDTLVSANDPFGFDVRQENSMRRVKPNFKLSAFEGSIPFYYNGWRKNGIGYFEKTNLRRNRDLTEKHKIFIPKAIGSGETDSDVIKAFIPKRSACCSETYIIIGPFGTEHEAKNVISYVNTKFFHFFVGLKKNTQEARRNVYSLVPIQDFSKKWTDEQLFEKYALTDEEIDFIKNLVPNLD